MLNSQPFSNQNKHANYIALLTLSFCAIFFANDTHAHASEDKSVSIPMLDWSSQRVISKAIGNLLTRYGYQVKYHEMSEKDLWGALARGKVHFHLEVWQASTSDEFGEKLSNGHLNDLGLYTASSREEWWYPKHVEQLCPGLPDWKALNRCAKMFSDDGLSKGDYITGPWPYRDANLIRGLKLNFKIKRYKNYDNIWKKLAKAQQDNKPIVLLNWSPNWTDERVGGTFVEFPAYTPECETNPQWGINKRLAFDCGNIKSGWIKKAGWPKLEATLPCVYQLVRNVDLNNQMIAEASALVDYDLKSESEAANLWLNKYQYQVDNWVSDTCLIKPLPAS